MADLSAEAASIEAARACACGDEDGSSASESDDISMGSLLLLGCWDEGAFACGDDGCSASESGISIISLLSGFWDEEEEEAIVAPAGCRPLRWC